MGQLPGLAVQLLHRNAAPDDILCHGSGGVVVFIIRPSGDNGELSACAAYFVALAGRYLTERPVIAVGKVVGGELAVLVRCVLFYQSAALVHTVLCSCQRAVTLGSAAGLAVILGDCHPPLLQDVFKVDGGCLPLGQLERLRFRLNIPVRNIYLSCGIGDFRAISLIDGHGRHINITVHVRSDVSAAPIVPGNLELDAAHFAVSGSLFQAGIAHCFGLHLDVAAHRLAASGVVGCEILLAAVAGTPDSHGPFAAHCCAATINAGRRNR